MAIDVRHVTKAYGSFQAVKDVSFSVAAGELVALLGPSGSGKTTMLRMIAGFEMPTSGTILLDGADVTNRPPFDRDVNTVFQDYALFPHMTVAQNVEYGLKVKRVAKGERRTRVAEALATVRLDGFDDRKPSQLSGGQRQRVALARALVNRPRILLLDEPLGALDAKLRKQLQLELKALQQQVGITFIYVTHDQEEALTMSDRIAVMSDGRVEQVAGPQEVYEEPSTTFVADFLGVSNLMTATAEGESAGRCRVKVGDFELHAGRGDVTTTGETRIVIRPERVKLEPADATGENYIPGMVDRVVYLGNANQVITRLAHGETLQALVQNTGDELHYKQGDPVKVHLPPEALRVLTDTGVAPVDENAAA